jgi:hypothetical protein
MSGASWGAPHQRQAFALLVNIRQTRKNTRNKHSSFLQLAEANQSGAQTVLHPLCKVVALPLSVDKADIKKRTSLLYSSINDCLESFMIQATGAYIIRLFTGVIDSVVQ